MADLCKIHGDLPRTEAAALICLNGFDSESSEGISVKANPAADSVGDATERNKPHSATQIEIGILPVVAIRMQEKANTIQNGGPILPVKPKKTLVADSRDVEEIAELEARVEDVKVSGEVIWPKLRALVMHAPRNCFRE